MIDYDISQQQLKVLKNNEEWFNRRNWELVEEGRELRERLMGINRELEGVRLEKERLVAEVKVMRENMPMIKPSSSVYTQ